MNSPSIDEINSISEKYGFNSDYLTSVLDPDEVSRSEWLEQDSNDNPILISFLYPIKKESTKYNNSFETRTMSIVLMDDVLITATENTPSFINNMFENYTSEEQGAHFKLNYIVIEICWQITRRYINYLKSINARIDVLHEQLKTSTRSELMIELSLLQKSIVYFDTAINENHPILEGISTSPILNSDKISRDRIHDVLVENHQAEKMMYQSREMTQVLGDAFTGIISNNLNIVMKILTSLTIIVTIPTITAGIWGMNVALPFADHQKGFWIVMGITVLLCIISAWWLRKKDLI